jgi:hypothetical protein
VAHNHTDIRLDCSANGTFTAGGEAFCTSCAAGKYRGDRGSHFRKVWFAANIEAEFVECNVK